MTDARLDCRTVSMALSLIAEGRAELKSLGYDPPGADELIGWLAVRAIRYRNDVSKGHVRAGLPRVTPKEEQLPSPTAIEGEGA